MLEECLIGVQRHGDSFPVADLVGLLDDAFCCELGHRAADSAPSRYDLVDVHVADL